MENLRMDRDGNLKLANFRKPQFDSDYIPPHHRWTPYAGPVIWTGPEGNRDNRPHLLRDWQHLGIGDVTPEKTLSATYISRAPADLPFPKSRHSAVGEIGWFYEKHRDSIRRVVPENLPR